MQRPPKAQGELSTRKTSSTLQNETTRITEVDDRKILIKKKKCITPFHIVDHVTLNRHHSLTYPEISDMLTT